MLRVYQYTMKKYIKSPSTWIILLLTMILEVVLGGYLPFNYLNNEKATPINYILLISNIVAIMSTFLAIFVSVFSAFKATNMLKDEIENKTFLVILSKPLNRRQILFGKWFALQTTLVLYTLIVSFTFSIALFSFDTGNTIEGLKNFHGIKIVSKNVHIIGFYLWVILIVMSLIFSSITLLISTKLNVGTTIGISIAIGIVIPITTLIKTFTQKAEYLRIDNENLDFLNDKNHLQLIKNSQSNINKPIQKYKEDPNTFYETAIKTRNKDKFKNLWYFDINFQIQILSEFITDNIIPKSIKKIINNSDSKWKPTNFRLIKQAEKISSIKELNKSIDNLWNIFQPHRLNLISMLLNHLSSYNNENLIFKNLNDIKLNKKLHLQIKNFAFDSKLIGQINKKSLQYLTQYIQQMKTNSKTTDIEKDIKFYKIIKNIENNLIWSFFVLDKKTQSIIIYMYNIFNLLPTFINKKSINLIIDDYNLEPKINYHLLTKENTQNSMPLSIIKNNINENQMYSKMATLIKEKIYLNKVSSESYVDKINILIFYLVIVVILLPATYFVIRKQDFR